MVFVFLGFCQKSKSQIDIGFGLGKNKIGNPYDFWGPINNRFPNQYNSFAIVSNIKNKVHIGIEYSNYFTTDTISKRGFTYKSKDQFLYLKYAPIILKVNNFSLGIGVSYGVRKYFTSELNRNTNTTKFYNDYLFTAFGLFSYIDYKINSRISLINIINYSLLNTKSYAFGLTYRFGKPFKVEDKKDKKRSIKFS